MSTIERTTMHPRYCLKESRLNDANLLKHKCVAMKF